MSCGIYAFTAPSGNQYIGRSKDIPGRRRSHLNQLRKGKHCNFFLQRAFNKYGAAKLKFEILFLCEEDELVFEEQRLLDELRPVYNIAQIAAPSSHSENLSAAAKRRFEDPKFKRRWLSAMRKAHKERLSDPEVLKEALAYMTSPAAKAKRKASMATEEYRRRQSEIGKGSWPLKRRKARSIKSKSLWKDPEAANKISAGISAHFSTPEGRKSQSEKAKTKMSCPKRRAEHASHMRLLWSDPVWAAQMRAKLNASITRGEDGRYA